MSNIKPITFNIGGQRYEISRSLLDQFPESMLANCASGQWLENPEKEIFIERDGAAFRYILNYMRDGSVFLPVTERKQSFIKELEYYGIEARDSDINDGKAKLTQYSFQLADSIHSELKNFKNQMEWDIEGLRLAIFCTDEFFKNHHSNLFPSTSQPMPRQFGKELEIVVKNHLHSSDDIYSLLQGLYKRDETINPVLASASRRLADVGLRVTSLQIKPANQKEDAKYSITVAVNDPAQNSKKRKIG